jgi:hypothetical protein
VGIICQQNFGRTPGRAVPWLQRIALSTALPCLVPLITAAKFNMVVPQCILHKTGNTETLGTVPRIAHFPLKVRHNRRDNDIVVKGTWGVERNNGRQRGQMVGRKLVAGTDGPAHAGVCYECGNGSWCGWSCYGITLGGLAGFLSVNTKDQKRRNTTKKPV